MTSPLAPINDKARSNFTRELLALFYVCTELARLVLKPCHPQFPLSSGSSSIKCDIINKNICKQYMSLEYLMNTPSYNFAAMPTKRMAAGAIFLNAIDNILIVKPTYRPDWLIPGGTIEADESPRNACEREIKEELDLDIPCDRLLCVEYLSKSAQQTESVHFVFYGGILTTIQIQQITLPDVELSEYRFSPIEEALTLLNSRLARRVPHCLQALQENGLVYLEDGRRV
jgi:8-oxo-dGTP diphosphatase